MSQEELVNAYVEGEISRRTLIRRLVAGGVTLGAASAYAQLIKPNAAGAAEERGELTEYPKTFVTIPDQSLDDAIADKRVKVKVRTVDINSLRVFVYKNKTMLGKADVAFSSAGSKNVTVPLDKVGILRGRDQARIKVIVSYHRPGHPGFRELTRKLKTLKKEKRG